MPLETVYRAGLVAELAETGLLEAVLPDKADLEVWV
jgi:hypothetical protein